MEGIKSVLVKDTTREERIRIVNRSLAICGTECEFCNGCDNIGGGRTETFYQPYIDGPPDARNPCGFFDIFHQYQRLKFCDNSYFTFLFSVLKYEHQTAARPPK